LVPFNRRVSLEVLLLLMKNVTRNKGSNIEN
jgi:hypothetical protein